MEPNHNRRDLLTLSILVLVALMVKLALWSQTEVLARDGIRYIRYAHRLLHEPPLDVLRSAPEHPLYPLLILFVHMGRQATDEPIAWQFSAQLANSAASLLLVPVYFGLVRRWFDRVSACWSGLLLQVLPAVAPVLADALSEGLFLLAFALCCDFFLRGLETGSGRWFVLAGLAGAVAYLTRPEGLVLVAASGGFLAFIPLLRGWPHTTRQQVAGLVGLSVGFALLGLPYAACIGGLTSKPAGSGLFHAELLNEAGPLFAVRFMPTINDSEFARTDAWKALVHVTKEAGQAFFYVLWIPCVVGMASTLRRRDNAWSAQCFMLGYVWIHLALLWRVALTSQYVSGRYFLPILLLGLPFASRAIMELLTYIQACTQSPYARFVKLTLLLALTGLCLYRSVQPLHQSQTGHRQIARWLCDRLQPDEELIDPYGWAEFYTSRSFRPRREHASSLVVYVIEQPGEDDRHRHRMMNKAETDTSESVVHAWPSEERAKIVIRRRETIRAE